MKPLSSAQLLDARLRIIENAQALLIDADLLIKNSRYARAFSLAVLACEEIAKLPMLSRAEVALELGAPVDWDRLGSRMRSHRHKLDLIDVFDKLLAPEAPSDEELLRIRAAVGQVSRELNAGKQDGFYVDVSEGAIRAPVDIITKERAEQFIAAAVAVVHVMTLNPAATQPVSNIFTDPDVRAHLKHLYKISVGESRTGIRP